ncbi:hypothetical protein LX88_003370 [Lentzea californiensis]|nr:hypothetical protein [Lentzea californiensis]
MVKLGGEDVGMSFPSMHQPETGETTTAFGDTAEDAWRIARRLDPQE